MSALGNTGNTSYERYVHADYKGKKMPEALSPKYGVPTGDRLELFYKTVEKLGVPVTVDFEKGQKLPLNAKGYAQLLETIAGIIADPFGFMNTIKGINLFHAREAEVNMSSDGTLGYSVGPITDKYEPNPSYGKSFLESIDALNLGGKHRNPTLAAHHEGIHNFLHELCNPILGIKTVYSSRKELAFRAELASSLIKSYIEQLEAKNAPLLKELELLITPYYRSEAQEFFTTFFELVGRAIASENPTTQAMADAVGGDLEQLKQSRSEKIPLLAENQIKVIKEVHQLMKETSFDVDNWWLKQYELREDLCPTSKTPKVLLPLHKLKSRNWDIEVLKHLDKTHPELYQFILTVDKEYPALLGPSFLEREEWSTHEPIVKEFYQKASKEAIALFNQFSELIYTPLKQSTKPEEDREGRAGYFRDALQELHSSFQFTHQQGRENPNDDLFYSYSIKNGLPIPFLDKQKAFLERNKVLLDLPRYYVELIDSIWHNEKEMMITMLSRLV